MIPTLLATMIPLLLLVATATTMMTGRNSLLLRSIHETRALLAATAAVEDAAQSAQDGTLVDRAVVTRALGNGVSYEYQAVYLGRDGDDNDGDGTFDEADERAFLVDALGRHGRAARRLSAIVVEPASSPAFNGSILALGDPLIRTDGTALVSGHDRLLDGSRASPTNDIAGISTQPPYTAGILLANYVQNGSSSVEGVGPTPSFAALATQYNMPGLVSAIRVAAGDHVIEPGTWTSPLGDARRDDYCVAYCPGDLHLSSARGGAGTLLVMGHLTVSGSFRWDGLVVVLGNLTVEGNAMINGGVIQGPNAESLIVRGSARVQYCSEILGRVNGTVSSVFAVDGWREIAR